MKICDKCGASADESWADSSSGLDFLEEASNSATGAEDNTLCKRCREEKRLTGAALVSDMGDFGEY